MNFKLTSAVEVGLDKNSAISHLTHPQQPFSEAGVTDARTLATDYVRAVASLYGIDPHQLNSPEKEQKLASEPTEEGTQLRIAHVKEMMGTWVVSFAQTHFGLPIWEAGVTVTMLENPLRVTSSYQSLRPQLGEIRAFDRQARFAPAQSDEKAWGGHLGLNAAQAKKFKLNRTRLLIYRYEPKDRIDPECTSHGGAGDAAMEAGPPTLNLPPVPPDVQPGVHYVVTEVLFTLPVENWGPLNWRAFVETKTGAVLYLRAFVSGATGAIFRTDPLTASGGTTPASPLALLNPLRSVVTLPGLTPPVAPAPWALTGNYVRIADTSPPVAAAPTSPSGSFVYDATTDDFSAVDAYYHCDGLFRLMESMGFNVSAFFDGTSANPGFPVPVDHRGLNDVVNAQGPGNAFGDGSGGFIFARAQAGTTVGIANDPRVVAHEFCHALLWDSVHSPNFGFAHSAGDGLGAILNDPGSLAPDRFMTFPWVAAGTPGLARRHDRPVGAGWAWGGMFDVGSYSSEQILATTLFRFYRAIGGDSAHPTATIRLATQQAAARKAAYLIIRGIGSLGTSPITPSPIPDVFASALMNADIGTSAFDTIPGGTVHKVIRWSFEKQGLYQPLGTPHPITTPGAPPPVDVFIDDGRNGEYAPYLENYAGTAEIWNRLDITPGSGPGDDQTPILGQANYAFVRVRNRGSQPATDVVVSAYRRRPGTPGVWPADWQALSTASLSVAGGIAAGGNVTVGPFKWTPVVEGTESLLISVSATGDSSNADPASLLPSAAGPTPVEQLVPFDNNIAVRNLAPIHGDDHCAVELESEDPECVSPAAPPWLPLSQCMIWYEDRIVRDPTPKPNREFTLEFRLVYEHSFCLLGRQQGPLLYTTTLLPGEKLKLYQFDRYRRVRATTDTYSVHTSFRQYVAALHQTRNTTKKTDFQSVLNRVRADGDSSVDIGSALFPFSWSIEGLDSVALDIERSASVESVSDDFQQTLVSASFMVDTERSTVISTFEEQDSTNITSREIHNPNTCRAVTYFVRKVMEAYSLSTRLAAIYWRVRLPGQPVTPWRLISDTVGVNPAIVARIKLALPLLPKVGEVIERERRITLPTDGTLTEAELAHCCSCDAETDAAQRIALEKAQAEARRLCHEVELLDMEIQRRRKLLENGTLDPFESAPGGSTPTP